MKKISLAIHLVRRYSRTDVHKTWCRRRRGRQGSCQVWNGSGAILVLFEQRHQHRHLWGTSERSLGWGDSLVRSLNRHFSTVSMVARISFHAWNMFSPYLLYYILYKLLTSLSDMTIILGVSLKKSFVLLSGLFFLLSRLSYLCQGYSASSVLFQSMINKISVNDQSTFPPINSFGNTMTV